MLDLKLTPLEKKVMMMHRAAWVMWEAAWQGGGAVRMAKWLALASSPQQFALAQTCLWSINGAFSPGR